MTYVLAQDTRTPSEQPTAEQPTLLQPTLNAYSRQRARATRPASNAVFQGLGVRKTKAPKGIDVEQRLREFPGETFCKSAGFLFCRGCKKQLPMIKQSIVIHKNSETHRANKEKCFEQSQEDEGIKQILSDYFTAHPTESQASLSPDTLLKDLP